MNRKISPRGQRRRGHSNSEMNHVETSVDGSTDFNVDDESDSNIRYTSTPLKTSASNRIQRRSSAPNFDSEESTDPVARAPQRPSKRRKKERISDARAVETAGHEDGGRRGSKRRRRRSDGEKNEMERLRKEKKAHKPEKSGELPIADLLRKAQENQKSLQTRYEDPTPLPELTTDTIYVQGRNGFSAVKIGNLRNEKSYGDKSLQPIHVAIRIHDFSKTLMFFCQGLLGGIALSQVILTPKTSQNFTDYPGHVMSGIFLFLVTVSLVAAMDRIDLAHLDPENLREIFSHRCITMVTFPLYLAAICIHLIAMNGDRNAANVSQETEGSDETLEYALHSQIHTWKFVLCIMAWLCISLGPNDDLTTINLEAMQKYGN